MCSQVRYGHLHAIQGSIAVSGGFVMNSNMVRMRYENNVWDRSTNLFVTGSRKSSIGSNASSALY